MLKYLAAGLPALLVFLVLDSLWIGLVALPQFRTALGDLLLFRAAPGIVFYIIYIAGMLVFAVSPAFASGEWTTALGYGAMLGLCAYSTYDLTNYATLRPWTFGIAAMDIAWGTFVTAAASSAGFLAAGPLLRLFR